MHNSNFPVSAISSNNSPTAGCAIKNQGCVCLSEHIMLQTKQTRTLPSTAILVVDANSLVLHLSSQGNCVPEVKYLSDIIDKNKTFKLYTLSQIVYNFKEIPLYFTMKSCGPFITIALFHSGCKSMFHTNEYSFAFFQLRFC